MSCAHILPAKKTTKPGIHPSDEHNQEHLFIKKFCPGVRAHVPSPVQLHEIPAGVGHMVHLQVRGSSEHPRDDVWSQREAGGVHEIKQQGDAGWVQRDWE